MKKTLKLLVFLTFVTCYNTSFSQCQPVCIVGASSFTVVPSGTQSVAVTNSPTVTALPAGNQSVTVTNTVTVTGTVTTSGGGTVTVSNAFVKETTYRDSVHHTNSTLLFIDNDIQTASATNTANLDEIKDSLRRIIKIVDSIKIYNRDINGGYLGYIKLYTADTWQTAVQIQGFTDATNSALRSQFTNHRLLTDTISGNELSVANIGYLTYKTFYSGSTNLINDIDGLIQVSNTKLAGIDNDINFYGQGLIGGGSDIFLKDGNNRSVFKTNGNESYLKNTDTQDMTFSNATLAGLQTDINTWKTTNVTYRCQPTAIGVTPLGVFFAIITYIP